MRAEDGRALRRPTKMQKSARIARWGGACDSLFWQVTVNECKVGSTGAWILVVHAAHVSGQVTEPVRNPAACRVPA